MTQRYTSLNLVFGDEKDRNPSTPVQTIDLGSPEQVQAAASDLTAEIEGAYSDNPWRDPLAATMTLIELIERAEPAAKTGLRPDIISRAFKAIEHKIETIPPEKEDPFHWAFQHHMFGCTVVKAGLAGLPPDQETVFRKQIAESEASIARVFGPRKTTGGLSQPE
jgi:hypothetical protein